MAKVNKRTSAKQLASTGKRLFEEQQYPYTQLLTKMIATYRTLRPAAWAVLVAHGAICRCFSRPPSFRCTAWTTGERDCLPAATANHDLHARFWMICFFSNALISILDTANRMCII